MIKLLKELLRFTPFPCIYEEIIYKGIVDTSVSPCRSCKSHICRTIENANTIEVCHKGLISYSQLVTESELLIFYGIRQDMFYTKRRAEITSLINNITMFLTNAEEIEKENFKEFRATYHDVIPAVSVVTRNAELLIGKSTGVNYTEKIENSSRELRDLFASVRLLNKRLSMIPYLLNPEKIILTKSQPTPIYKIVDKYVKLFEGYALQDRKRILLKGPSHNSPYLKPIFELIPFVLIENAIKYSFSEQDINVQVVDSNNNVIFRIESLGYTVPEDHHKTIFEKNVRYEHNSEELTSGSGLGLHFANMIAEIHKFNINYSYISKGTKDSKPIGLNLFEFTIPAQ